MSEPKVRPHDWIDRALIAVGVTGFALAGLCLLALVVLLGLFLVGVL